MNIVVEGADGSGKSTLVSYLRQSLRWNVVASEGPTKTPRELNDRAMRFLALEETIFDRHCIVSERVYGGIRGNIMTLPELEAQFYMIKRPLLIYCRSDSNMLDQIVKAHDTTEHLALVTSNHQRIIAAYDDWAVRHAHIVFRKFDEKSRILSLILGVIKCQKP